MPAASTQATRPIPDKGLCKAIKASPFVSVFPVRTEVPTASLGYDEGVHMLCCYDDIILVDN